MNQYFDSANSIGSPQHLNRAVFPDEEVMISSFFVVQKCWYSGPKVTPTVDYLRLLPSLAEAEQVAYQSAHIYAGGASPVRTIQVPIKHDAASTYGFVANGTLFWIRRIQVYTSSGVAVSSVVDSAHCILTHGVIGGTGNQGSRRGSEDLNSPRVFVGPAGYAWALKQSASGLVPSGSTCQWVPVGKPNCENITAEWPDRSSWHIPTQPKLSTHLQSKRISDASQSGHWFKSCSSSIHGDSDEQEERFFQSSTSMETDGTESNYVLMPPAKRRCPARNILQPDLNCGFFVGAVASSQPMDVFMGN